MRRFLGFPFSLAAFAVALCLPSPLILAQGPANSWTNLTSGSWEESHWSLGTLPAPGQSVSITNAGWKAVAIGPGTVQNFPASLAPDSVTISSPTNSRNTLFLNSAGFAVPLAVSQLQLNSNSALINLGSRIAVSDVLSVGGDLIQGAYGLVSAGQIKLGDIGPGTYALTNGTVSANQGMVLGGSFPGTFEQYGGTNFSGKMELFLGGFYDLMGGDLTTSNIIYHSFSAMSGRFKQTGGTVNCDALYVTEGNYELDAGVLACPFIALPGITSGFEYADFGDFYQNGGTNRCSLSIGNYRPPYANASAFGSYTLSNGVLESVSISIGPYGSFRQYGGMQTNQAMGLNGDTVYYGAAGFANYALNGGVLSTRGISMAIASFSQSGGTNEVIGDLQLNTSGFFASTYSLTGGRLVTSNTIVNSSVYSTGGFSQSGGQHRVSNLLSVSRPGPAYGPPNPAQGSYLMMNGELTAPNITVDNGGIFQHVGGVVSNAGLLTLAGGTWVEGSATQGFGGLVLGSGQTSDSTLSFAAAPSVVRFGDSSAVAWSQQAVLIIANWKGSLAGNGYHQVYFGTNSAGLGSGQLAQIWFRDPDGSSGVYPAAVLSTGEVVPDRFLAAQLTGSGLRLFCSPGMVLQSAPTVSGPYADEEEAVNGYLLQVNAPQRFFRLRRATPGPNLLVDKTQ